MATTVVATGYGGPEVLALVDEPVGPVGPDQVLLEVRAAGTNPLDFKLYSGDFGRDPAQLPLRLGFEASGVVRATGKDARGPLGALQIGDEVVAFRIEGGYATEVLVPASSVLPKPTTLSFVEASGLLLTGSTAVHALAVTGVGVNDTVVVHGAAGGVGLMAVQLAVAAGANVIGTAGEAQHPYLRELGAQPVVYGEGLVERIRALAPAGVDVAVDTVGTDEAIDTSLALVQDHQRIVTIAAFARGFQHGIKVIGGAPGADAGVEIRNAARVQLIRQAQAGQLRVLVGETYPLSEAASAHRALAAGHSHGKIILVPDSHTT